VSGVGGFENWYWIGPLVRVTDADTAIRVDENVPRVYLKAEDSVTVRTSVTSLEQSIERLRINVLIYRWDIYWLNIGSIRQSLDDCLSRRATTVAIVLGINNRYAPSIDGQLPRFGHTIVTLQRHI
jgi:hypothetical protein